MLSRDKSTKQYLKDKRVMVGWAAIQEAETMKLILWYIYEMSTINNYENDSFLWFNLI